MFDNLTRLAHDRSPERRGELLLSITDLFASAGRHVDDSIAELYTEIVEHLLPRVGDAERAEIAFRIADMPNAPFALTLRLARSDIRLAEPVLRLSRALCEDDLVALAAELPMEHRVAIASRRPVSERLTDALIQHGDASVRRAITENRAARLSPEALGQLVADAGARPAGQGADNLYRAGADVLLFRQPESGRRRTKRTSEPGGLVLAWPARSSAERASGVREDGDAVATVIAAIASKDRMLEVAILLAEHAGLPADLVSRLIARPDPTLLAVLCRAAGVSQATFSVIAEIRARRFGHPPEAIAKVEAVYAALSAADAQMALGRMRMLQQERSASAGTPS